MPDITPAPRLPTPSGSLAAKYADLTSPPNIAEQISSLDSVVAYSDLYVAVWIEELRGAGAWATYDRVDGRDHLFIGLPADAHLTDRRASTDALWRHLRASGHVEPLIAFIAATQGSSAAVVPQQVAA